MTPLSLLFICPWVFLQKWVYLLLGVVPGRSLASQGLGSAQRSHLGWDWLLGWEGTPASARVWLWGPQAFQSVTGREGDPADSFLETLVLELSLFVSVLPTFWECSDLVFSSLLCPFSGLGRFLGEGNGNPLQYSCLENPMDRGAWWATVHGVTKSQTRLRDFTFTAKETSGPEQSRVHCITQGYL